MLALIVMVGMFTAWVVPAACAIALQLVGAILFSDVTPKWIITPLLAREGRDIVSEWRRGYVYAHEVKKRAIRDKDAFSMRRHEAYEAAAVSERKEQWRFVHRVFACCVLLTLDIGSGEHSLFRSMAPLLSQIVTIEHPIAAHISAMIILWLFWLWLSFMPESRELMEHPELAEERLKRLQAERDHSDELVSRVRRGRAEIERACAEG